MNVIQRLRAPNKQLNNIVLTASMRMWVSAAAIVGALIVIGGAARWSGNIYTYLIIVPGSPAIWGIVLLTACAITIVGYHLDSKITLLVGLYLCAFWCLLFAMGIILAGITQSVAITTAVWLIAITIQFVYMAKLWIDYGKVS